MSPDTRARYIRRAVAAFRLASILRARAARIASEYAPADPADRYRVTSGGAPVGAPAEIRDAVRELRRAADRATDAGFNTWRGAGRRSSTARRMRDAVAYGPPNGRRARVSRLARCAA